MNQRQIDVNNIKWTSAHSPALFVSLLDVILTDDGPLAFCIILKAELMLMWPLRDDDAVGSLVDWLTPDCKGVVTLRAVQAEIDICFMLFW